MQVKNEQADRELASAVVSGLCSDYGGNIKGGFINGVKCLRCNKNNAFTNPEKPWRIKCNHANSCDAVLKYSEYFPTLAKEIYSKYKLPDPLERARFYAENTRGIKNFEKWGGNPVYKTILGEKVHALEFVLHTGEKKFAAKYRLVNHSKAKHSVWGDKSKAMWIPKTEIDFDKPIVIAEDPVKAMGLLEAQIQAVGVLSSNCLPEYKAWIKENLNNFVCIILAFDNDPGGWKATKAWVKFLKDEDLPYEIAFPTEGKDWDDMWKDRELNEKSFEACKLEGRLFEAKNAEDAAKLIEDDNDFCPPVFEWKRAIYKTRYDKHKCVDGATKIINGVFRSAYSSYTQDHKRQRNFEHYVTFKPSNYKLGDQRILLNGHDLRSVPNFNEKTFNTVGTSFTGLFKDLAYIMDNLVKLQSMKQVRYFDRIGYDSESKAYIFPYMAVDQNGQIHHLNEDGYFTKLGVTPVQVGTDSKYIKKARIGELKRIITLIYQAWGVRGLVIMGYYIATILSTTTIFPKYKFFPHLSAYGGKNRGKSMLTKLLNQIFAFLDQEGYTMGNENTPKSILRIMSRSSSIPVVFKEGNDGQRLCIDENQILSLYNRDSAQTRANKSQDNSINELSYDAGLVMVQNVEWFKQGAAKERFVSVHFEERGGKFSDEERAAYNELLAMKPEELAGFGVELYKNRKFLEERIIKHIDRVAGRLEIDNDRVKYNHAIAIGGITCLLELCYGKDLPYVDELLAYGKTRASDKAETSVNTSDNVDHFIEAVKELMTPIKLSSGQMEHGGLKKGVHFIEDDETYYLRLTAVLQEIGNRGYKMINNMTIAEDLRRSPIYDGEFNKKSKEWSQGLQKRVFGIKKAGLRNGLSLVS